MKIIHTADIHGRLNQDKRYRKDLTTILRFIVDVVEEEKPNYLFIAGDLMDIRIPTPTEYGIMSAFIKRVLNTGTQVVMIPGNHDTPLQKQYLNTLRVMENFQIPGLHIMSEVGTLALSDCYILGIPYAYTDKEFVRNKAKQLHDALPTDKPTFALVHSWVDSYLSLPVDPEKEFNTSKEFLDSLYKVKYFALGHIHIGGPVSDKAWYCGSPFRITLGETEPEKFLLKWEDGNITKLVTPALPIKVFDVKSPGDITGITNTICKINAKNISPELLGDVHDLHDKLKTQDNFVFIDLELQTMQFDSAVNTKSQSFEDFRDDYIKRNDIVKFKNTYASLCNKIINEQVTDKTTPFSIDELYEKGGLINEVTSDSSTQLSLP